MQSTWKFWLHHLIETTPISLLQTRWKQPENLINSTFFIKQVFSNGKPSLLGWRGCLSLAVKPNIYWNPRSSLKFRVVPRHQGYLSLAVKPNVYWSLDHPLELRVLPRYDPWICHYPALTVRPRVELSGFEWGPTCETAAQRFNAQSSIVVQEWACHELVMMGGLISLHSDLRKVAKLSQFHVVCD